MTDKNFHTFEYYGPTGDSLHYEFIDGDEFPIPWDKFWALFTEEERKKIEIVQNYWGIVP